MINVIIGLILFVVIIFAVRSTIRRILGKESCCSSGSSVIRENKKLTDPIILEKTVFINGMECENCAARIEHSLNQLPEIACKVSLKNQSANIQLSKNVQNDKIIEIIQKSGYSVQKITEKNS